MVKIIIGYGLHVCACIEAQNPHSMCMQVPPALTKLSHTRALYILDQRYLRTLSQLVKPINSVSFSTSEGRLTDQFFTLHLWFLDCSSPLGKKKTNPNHTLPSHTQTVQRDGVEESMQCLILVSALQQHLNQHERNVHPGGWEAACPGLTVQQ